MVEPFSFFGEIKDYEKYHIRLVYLIFEKILKERFNNQAKCDFADKTLCDFYFEVNVDKTLESLTIGNILGIYNNEIKQAIALLTIKTSLANLF